MMPAASWQVASAGKLPEATGSLPGGGGMVATPETSPQAGLQATARPSRESSAERHPCHPRAVLPLARAGSCLFPRGRKDKARSG